MDSTHEIVESYTLYFSNEQWKEYYGKEKNKYEYIANIALLVNICLFLYGQGKLCGKYQSNYELL